MLRKAIVLAGVALMATVAAAAQNPRRQYIDLRPELEKGKFTEGKHFIKTLPDGKRLSLGFKSSRVVEIYLTDKKGKEFKAALSDARVSHEPLPPEAHRDARSISVSIDSSLVIDFCTDNKGCRNSWVISIADGTSADGTKSVVIFVDIRTCCD